MKGKETESKRETHARQSRQAPSRCKKPQGHIHERRAEEEEAWGGPRVLDCGLAPDAPHSVAQAEKPVPGPLHLEGSDGGGERLPGES